jgi:hypothetical protein
MGLHMTRIWPAMIYLDYLGTLLTLTTGSLTDGPP